MRADGFEVFVEGGVQRRYGQVGQRCLVSEHWALLWISFVPFWKAGAARARVRRPRLNDHHGALVSWRSVMYTHGENVKKRTESRDM